MATEATKHTKKKIGILCLLCLLWPSVLLGAPVTVHYEVKDAPVIEALEQLIRAAGDPRPALDEAGQFLTQNIVDLFRQGQSPYGDPWPPSRRAKETGGTTLIDRGHLRDANTHRVDGLGAGATLTVGNSMKYARAHNEGFEGDVVVNAHNRLIQQAFGRPLAFPVWQTVKTHARHMRLPKRQFYPDEARGLPDPWAGEILDIFSHHLTKAQEQARG